MREVSWLIFLFPEGPPLKTRSGTSEIQATHVDTIQLEPLWSRLR